MIVKKHKTRDGRLVLAICDNSLKGKIIEDDKLQLDLSSNFYDGKEMSEEELLKFFNVAYIINLVGEESVNLAVKQGLIEEKNILKINNVPHAECVLIRD